MACPSDCSAPPGKIQPYGDIAGIGVMLSFLLSAFMLVIFVASYYLAMYDPNLDPYRKTSEPHLPCKIPNPIDRTFLRIVRKLPRLIPSKFVESGALESALIRSARMFSDLQICTGFAILISGFRAYSCDLQSYHWQLIVYMAWLASVTHASVLSSLRNYLLNHHRQLWWRFGGMFVIATMLLVAIALTYDFTWNGDGPKNLAKCPGSSAVQDALETKLKLGFFLAYGYGIRILKLFPVFDNTPRLLSRWLKRKSILIQDGGDGRLRWDPHRRPNRHRTRFVDPVIIAFCRTAHIHLDLLTSFLAEVFWLVVSFVWATKRLLTIRATVRIAEEDEWTFGQIFPLVLLAAPIVTLIDHFSRRPHTLEGYNATSAQEAQELTDLRDQPSPPPQHQQVDEQFETEYESRISFRGASVIAGFTYVHIAIFIFASDDLSRSIAYTFGTLALSCLVFHPVLQMTWVVYSLWIPKHALGEHRIAPLLDIVFLATFLLSITNSSWQVASEAISIGNIDYSDDRVETEPILRVVLTMCGLFSGYLIFLGWFTWDSHVRIKPRNRCLFGRKAYLRYISIVSSGLFSFGAALPYITWVVVGKRSERMYKYLTEFRTVQGLSAIFGSVFVCQIIVELVELGIRHWARAYATPIRACFLATVTFTMIAVLYSFFRTLPDLVQPELIWLLPIISTCPFWVAFWVCRDIVMAVITKDDNSD